MADFSRQYDCIIVGGSFAGLSAALALGRSLKKTLIIDNGLPCNRQTPHAHNFFGSDGIKPALITANAKQQLSQYKTVSFHQGLVTAADKNTEGFVLRTEDGHLFHSKKLILAAGIRDVLPEIPGFSDCWGISVLHCPFCHGFEVAAEPTFIYTAGDTAFHLCMLISNWTDKITLVLSDRTSLADDQRQLILKHGITVVDEKIVSIDHLGGKMTGIRLESGNVLSGKVMYARVPFEQQGTLASGLGCELLDSGLLKSDEMQRSNVPGVFVAGDNSSGLRAISQSVAAGTRAGAAVVFDLNAERFV